MSQRAYEKLDSSGQAQVNAIILDYFRTDRDGFIDRFRAQVAKEAQHCGDRAKAFQGMLDNVRDVIAENRAYMPPIARNGVDDRRDVEEQRGLLRLLRAAMAEEHGRWSHPVGYYRQLTEKGIQVQLDGHRYRLPEIAAVKELPTAAILSSAAAKNVWFELAENDAMPAHRAPAKPTRQR
jgi:hypothetical protein